MGGYPYSLLYAGACTGVDTTTFIYCIQLKEIIVRRYLIIWHFRSFTFQLIDRKQYVIQHVRGSQICLGHGECARKPQQPRREDMRFPTAKHHHSDNSRHDPHAGRLGISRTPIMALFI